ncbi:MAG TPA: ABC transporter ATP-binding protein, partial [Blastocatellia bacterium]|nr:ABC transporter ATP-binding protein [Blastocatellia bacterium]
MSRAPGLRRTLQNQELPSLREQFSALRHVLPLLRLVWNTHRGYTSAIVILRLLQAFIPVATLWVGKLIIDTVVAAQSSGSYAGLWKLVLIEIGIVVAGDVLSRASILFESLLGDLFSNYTSIRLMEHAATLDLYHFEDPSFYDQLERARRQTTNRIGLLALLLGMGSGILTLISLSAVLLVYSPWLLLLLVVSVLPSFFGETRMASLGYSLLFRWTPERRQLDYLRYLGASDETAKEVQMFGLSRWIVDRYRVLSDRFYQENKKLSVQRAFVSSGLSFIGTLGYYTAYAVILFRAVQGSITLGSLTFLAGSFARSR